VDPTDRSGSEGRPRGEPQGELATRVGPAGRRPKAPATETRWGRRGGKRTRFSPAPPATRAHSSWHGTRTSPPSVATFRSREGAPLGLGGFRFRPETESRSATPPPAIPVIASLGLRWRQPEGPGVPELLTAVACVAARLGSGCPSKLSRPRIRSPAG